MFYRGSLLSHREPPSLAVLLSGPKTAFGGPNRAWEHAMAAHRNASRKSASPVCAGAARVTLMEHIAEARDMAFQGHDTARGCGDTARDSERYPEVQRLGKLRECECAGSARG